MSTENADGYGDHFRSITVTAIAAMAGIVAALVSAYLTAGQPVTEAAGSNRALMVVLGLIAIQPFLLRVIGLMKDDFGVKDALFIAFMTFSLWFITYGILLTTGTTAAMLVPAVGV